jgi:DnaJ family protein A protein 2
MSLYEKLGVSKEASKDDIKKAFRKLSLEHHPDKGGDEEKFKEISNAYDVLSDDDKRKNYDMVGSETQQPFNPFQQAFNPFEFMFNQRTRRQEAMRKLDDSIYTIEIPLEEVFFGKTRKMLVTTNTRCSCSEVCGKCNGNGKIQIMRQFGPIIQSMETQCGTCLSKGYIVKGCDTCNKEGIIKNKEYYEVNVPVGCIDGYEKRIVGKGQQPFKPSEIPGDLVFKIKVLEHHSFKRRGNDLLYETKISFIDSICGCEINIPHFDGEFKLNFVNNFGVIKEGKEYIIKNHGIKGGNLILTFKIEEYTKNLDKETRDKIRELLT